MRSSCLPSTKILQSYANIMLRSWPNRQSFILSLRQSATARDFYQIGNIYRQTGFPTFGRFNHTLSTRLFTYGYVQESTKVIPAAKFLSTASALSYLSFHFELGLRVLESLGRMMVECWTVPSNFHKGVLLRPNTKYNLPSGSYRFLRKYHGIVHMPELKPNLFACGAEVMHGLCQRRGQKGILMGSTHAGHNISLHLSKRVSGVLRNREPCGNNVLYKCFWSNMSSPIWRTGHHLESWMKNFSLSSTPSSTGAVPNISFDGISHEEQIEDSGASSNLSRLSGERTLKLLSGSCYLPHPEKEETGGEDAHFICNEQAIGVADGVGGWADLGVNSGHYARELMSHSVSAIGEEPEGSIDPGRVLEKAYISTKARGSSTACIVALTDQGVHAVNLGDSGFIIVREGCAVFRSPVQQHDFNFTYQLESGNASDLPSSGQVFTFPVKTGDVIVAGTDGLFDNLYANEVTAVILHSIRAGLGPQVTAQKIAALARQRALDRNRQTPFSAAAQEAGYRYRGGKLDDVTVVVSYVTASSTASST